MSRVAIKATRKAESGGRGETFRSRCAGEYGVFVDGQQVGRIWSDTDPEYPKAAVPRWTASVNGDVHRFAFYRDCVAWARRRAEDQSNG